MRDVEAALQREIAEQKAKNAALEARLAELLATNSKLVESVAKLTERVDELLASVKRKTRKAPPEKKPVPPPTLTDEQRRAFENRPKPPEKPIKPKPQARRPAPTGRKPIPQHLEVSPISSKRVKVTSRSDDERARRAATSTAAMTLSAAPDDAA